MNSTERTRDLFEQIEGYTKPPLVPLPDPGDLSSLDELGLKPGRISHGIVKTGMTAMGFRSFQKQLPDRLEDVLRRCDVLGGAVFTPVISATLALEDDPRITNPMVRAATLLLATRSLYQDVFSGKFEPDLHKGQVLEMGQYPNLFSTCQVVEGRKVRIFKSSNMAQITIAIARRLYCLKVWQQETETELRQIVAALNDVSQRAQENRVQTGEPAPGILTCATNATQQKVFHKLQKIKVNQESLGTLRHSFLILCLDLDSYPTSHAEAAFIAHSGNCGNRWNHSSLQLVVFGNARACVICNFSTHLAGNTMIRAAAEIQQRALLCPVQLNEKVQFINLAPATRLNWEISRNFIQQAWKDLRPILDNQQATFEICIMGKNFFKTHNIQPVPAFILALQMTAKRLIGRMANITQFLSMSKYRCMELTTTVVTTPAVTRFVESMDNTGTEPERQLALLKEAITSQIERTRKVREIISLELILALYFQSKSGIRRLYVYFIMNLTILVLRLLGLFKLSPREILVSHPKVYPEVPVVGRPGVRLPYVKYFGLHYQMMEEKIVITLMPGVDWTIPNAELIAELRKSLTQIQTIITGIKKKDH